MKTIVSKIAIAISFASLISLPIVANELKTGDPEKNKYEVSNSLKNISSITELPAQAEALSQVLSEKYNVKFHVTKTMSVKDSYREIDQAEQDELSSFEDSLARRTNVRFNVNDLMSVKSEQGF